MLVTRRSLRLPGLKATIHYHKLQAGLWLNVEFVCGKQCVRLDLTISPISTPTLYSVIAQVSVTCGPRMQALLRNFGRLRPRGKHCWSTDQGTSEPGASGR